jgi:dienelactone hydrolase
MHVLTAVAACLILPLSAPAEGPWPIDRFSAPPKHYPAGSLQAEGVRALFYEGPAWKGKPTRIFAWYGAPATKPGERVPAMVLVHGGGGTAFADWVRLWNGRGYAAIAMDTCGSLPAAERPRHDYSGPPGWDASFDQVDWPAEDQWTYHAVAAIMLANSLLRSFPEVDPERIGLTGISWGGYLTSIAGSVDSRFRFAVPVYGCGFLGDNSYWAPELAKRGDKGKRWLELWDPSLYLKDAKIPFLWLTGTNDFAYPLDSLQRSYRLAGSPPALAIRIRMPHGHEPGETPEEIHAFAGQNLNGGIPLTVVESQGQADGGKVWARYRCQNPVVRAELNFTRDSGVWEKRQWDTVPGEVDARHSVVTAILPTAVRVYFFNLIDARGLIVSSEHVVLP